jgi:hypothetical protein
MRRHPWLWFGGGLVVFAGFGVWAWFLAGKTLDVAVWRMACRIVDDEHASSY